MNVSLLRTLFCLFISWPVQGASSPAELTTETYRLIDPALPFELRSTSINAITQDSSGLLWIGTQNGLMRYDGHSTIIYGFSESDSRALTNRDVRAIVEAEEDTLLLGSFGAGIFQFKKAGNSSNHFIPVTAVPGQYVKSIVKSSADAFWISIDSKIVLYDRKTQRSSHWDLSAYTLSKLTALPITELASGELFVGVGDALFLVDPNERRLLPLEFSHPDLPDFFEITAVKKVSDRRVIIGTSKGVVCVYDIKTQTPVHLTKIHKRNVYIFDMLVRGDTLFVASDSGLFISKIDTFVFQLYEDSSRPFLSSDIFTLFSSRTFILAGTLAGLEVLSITPIELHNRRSSGISDVQAFAESPQKNTLWIGTYSGLFLLKGDAISHINVHMATHGSPEPVDERISSLIFFNHFLWVGLFDGGMYSVDLRSPEINFNHIEGSNEWAVLTLLPDRESNQLWVGTLNHGLFKIEDGNVSRFAKGSALEEKTISLLFRDSQGQVYVATIDKLYRYSPLDESFTKLNLTFPDSRMTPVISAMFESENGVIWIGTVNSGLFKATSKFRNGSSLVAERMWEASALNARTIYGIQEDSYGNVWISTNNGVVKLRKDGEILRELTVRDGLQHSDFSSGASFKSSDGRIFFGGPAGYNVIHPDQINDSSPAPKTIITSIQFASETHYPSMATNSVPHVRLGHSDKFITFHFSVMDFFAPRGSQYRYRLDNFDKDWIDNGYKNFATYTNLPAGNYTFQVKGRNAAGVWDSGKANISLRVYPPVWKTPLAYSLYTLALSLLAWMTHRVYYSYVVERNARDLAQEMYENEMLAEESLHEQIEYQDDVLLAAQQYRQETLDLIKAVVSSEHIKNESLPQNTAHGKHDLRGFEVISLLERYIVFNSEGPSINLHEFVDDVTSQLLRETDVDVDTIVLVNELPDHLTPSDVGAPFAVILLELLRNCFQHAFSRESPANYVIVRMLEIVQAPNDVHEYHLTVHDTGSGVSDNTDENIKIGSGFAVIQAIVKKFSGSFSINRDEGTRVEVILIPDLTSF